MLVASVSQAAVATAPRVMFLKWSITLQNLTRNLKD
jgi:hypothetical protein